MNIEPLMKNVTPALVGTALQLIMQEAERQGYRITPPGSIPMPRDRDEAQMMTIVCKKFLEANPEPVPVPTIQPLAGVSAGVPAAAPIEEPTPAPASATGLAAAVLDDLPPIEEATAEI